MKAEWIEELKKALSGQVRDDPLFCTIYSVDASIFEVTPLCVAIPENIDDLKKAIKIANQHRVPLIPRGAATGIAGGAIGEGLVLDLTKLNNIIKIEESVAVVEPGVVQDVLNQKVQPLGLRLGPDTSTGNRATVGGMFACNAAGARSLRYGPMVDAVIACKMMLSDGTVLVLGQMEEEAMKQKASEENFEGQIYQKLLELRHTLLHENVLLPSISRRASGYRLEDLTKPFPLNLAKLAVGSEGTLGVITEMTLKLSPLPRSLGLVILHFESVKMALEQISELLTFSPLSLELIDHHILNAAAKVPSTSDSLKFLTKKSKALLVVEVEGGDLKEVEEFTKEISKSFSAFSPEIILDPQQMQEVWTVRKNGLGLLLSKRSYSRAIAFLEDVAVPYQVLPEFFEAFLALLNEHGKDAGVYGHAGAGCLHIRPYIDLRSQDEIDLMKTLMHKTTELLRKHEGVLSGEHGDGWIRSWLNPELFGEKIYQSFIELKKSFDPLGLLNPRKKVLSDFYEEKLRLTPKTLLHEPESFLNFEREGGFALSADLCNGNGQCRKTTGLMCPSFQATYSEFDTTRARAQALRSALKEGDNLALEGLKDVLDLCLSCKGCKRECPSSVDMAKMKAEVEYQWQKKHGSSMRNWLFAHLAEFNEYGYPFKAFYNKWTSSELYPYVAPLLGLRGDKRPPLFSAERFTKSWKNWGQTNSGPAIVLWIDTYTEFYRPEVGWSAVSLLEKMGYQVIVPPWSCCGRPAFSKGFLELAKANLQTTLDTLRPYIEKGIPIVGLEPSCVSMMKDDSVGLLGKESELAIQIMSIDEWLAKNASIKQIDSTSCLVHTHCHQKALWGSKSTLDALYASGYRPDELPTGCCGMAGSFGFEKEHATIADKIGEQILFPAVRSADSTKPIIANGFSCASHIERATGRKVLHLVEALDRLEDINKP